MCALGWSPAPDRLPPELETTVGGILSRWGGNEFLNRISKPSKDSAEILKRLRKAYGRLSTCAPYVPRTAPERYLLNGSRQPRSEQEVDTLYGRFNLRLITETARLQPNRLEPTVQILVELPPLPPVFRYLLSLWLHDASPDDFEPRCQSLEQWIRREVTAASEEWTALIAAAREQRSRMTAPSTSVPEPPEAVPDVTATASPAEESSITSDELRAAVLTRFGELRSAALHDPQRFVATRRALHTASGRLDELATSGLVLQHGAELRDFLALQVKTLSELLESLPPQAAIDAAGSEVTRATDDWLQIPRLQGARAWLGLLEQWSDVTDVLALASSDLLDLLPDWFFRSIAGDSTEPRFAALVSREGRLQLYEAVAWLDDLSSAERAITTSLAPGEGSSAFDQLQRASRSDRSAHYQMRARASPAPSCAPRTLSQRS